MTLCRTLALCLPVLATLASVPAALASEAPAKDAKPAEKEDEGGKARQAGLEERIRPVSGNVFLKKQRFEISPTLAMSLADAFFQKYGFGIKLDYHLAETFSVGAFASYSLDTPGGAVTVCKDEGTPPVTTCSSPTLDQLKNVPGKLGLMAGVEAGWAPIYGKLNVVGEKVLHFDVQLSLGGGVIQYEAPGGASAMAVGAHVGLGQRFFITPSVTLRVELRDYLYSAQTVPLGDTNSKLENQLMFELGVSFFAGDVPKD